MINHLFIGRFQPLHKGHLSIMEKILSDPQNHLLIGIGSSQESGTDRNPFTYQQRKQTIQQQLSSQNYTIFPIPDIHDPENWAEHTLKLCPKKPQFLHTGSPEVKHCFQLYQGQKPQIIHIDRSIIPISATQIRKQLFPKQ